MQRRLFALALLLVASLVATAADPARDPRLDPDAAEAGYLGVAVCAECHAKETEQWRGSHHDLAMAPATEAMVLGDFDDAELTAQGVTSTFFRRDGRYFVRTDGSLGELQDYPIAYTFGWYPLQQYLIEFPGGRLQSLGLAWDARPESEGGQRWFHLYPDRPIDHTDPLHWTGLDQIWNYQCADCHSTALKKGYDQASDSYTTRYAEIDVACETCHGPGARHVGLARAAADGNADAEGWDAPGRGLMLDLADRDGGEWTIDPETSKPRRSVARTTHAPIEVCAPCHSRRGRIWDELPPGGSLHDGYRLSLLEPELYFADGQIRDEVYVYGSFIQSRMYHQGVVCGDCHEPHSLALRAEGNAVCARCHVAASYDNPAHHHHEHGTDGAACVACHMPQRDYMVMDERADHSMRIPRPDLSARIGTPNACNQCHQDKDAAWAAAAVADWYPDPVHRGPHFGEVFAAAERGDRGAAAGLLALAGDPGQAGIVRASALARLHAHPSQDALLTVRRLLADPEPLVRAQAVRLLDRTDLRTRTELAWPLLDDPARSVRLEVASVLAPLLRQGMGDKLRDRLVAAMDESARSAMTNADRPEAHFNLGLLAAAAGEPRVAEGAYKTALRIDPSWVPAYANLADLYRAMGRESAAEAKLRAGLVVAPENPDLHHALGLSLVRAGRTTESVATLRRSAELAPDNARYAYVLAVALDGAGDTGAAVDALAAAQTRAPENPDLLSALVEYSVKLGQGEAARLWLDRLAAVIGSDAAVVERLRALVLMDGLEPGAAPDAEPTGGARPSASE